MWWFCGGKLDSEYHAWLLSLGLPIDLKAKQRAVLRRISAEQAGAELFSDLYAERAAILLHFSKPSASDAHRWMHTMVNAYLENGMWAHYSESMVYDGETIIGAPAVC
jgi:hypothetical protein